jgi:hypothetical protein
MAENARCIQLCTCSGVQPGCPFAHRLSTARNAHAILVIEDGQIIERGDHDDLLAQRGRYLRLHTEQFELDWREAGTLRCVQSET